MKHDTPDIDTSPQKLVQDASNVTSPEKETASFTAWSACTRMIVGAVLASVLCVYGPGTAQAQFSVLTAIISTASNIGKLASAVCGSEQQMQNYTTSVIAPINQLRSAQSWMSSAQTQYSSWMNGVNVLPIKSGALPQTSAFETSLYSGLMGQNRGSSSSFGAQYIKVYGAQPAPNTVSKPLANVADFSDATASEAIALAGKSDQFSTQLLSTANTMQKQAASACPGTAPMLQAQAAALELNSNAVMHRLLASMLRQQSTQLANEMSKVKGSVTTHGSQYQLLQLFQTGVH
jgi:hypothetical protein